MFPPPDYRILVLFSGTGSVEDALKEEHRNQVAFVSVDNDPKFTPTHLCRVQDFPYRSYPPGYFYAVWASPPCTEYSVAKTVGVRDFVSADSNVCTALSIIDYLRPKYWFIENPRGHLRLRPFMQPLEPYMHTCTYCMYGTPFRKPTNIWTNVGGLSLCMCTRRTPCNSITPDGRHPSTAQSGHHKRDGVVLDKGTRRNEAYRIPSPLVKALFSGILVKDVLQDGDSGLQTATGHDIPLQVIEEGEGDDTLGVYKDRV
jgi:hypothetical protein